MNIGKLFLVGNVVVGRMEANKNNGYFGEQFLYTFNKIFVHSFDWLVVQKQTFLYYRNEILFQ